MTGTIDETSQLPIDESDQSCHSCSEDENEVELKKAQRELSEKRQEEAKIEEMREKFEANSVKETKSTGISCGILDNEQLSLFMLDSLAFNSTLRKLIEAKRKFEIVPEE